MMMTHSVVLAAVSMLVFMAAGTCRGQDAVFIGGNGSQHYSVVSAPTAFGSGCLLGSTNLSSNSDGDFLSIEFADYAASTSGSHTRDRKSCNVVVPMEIDDNYKVGIYRVDYNGYVYVPDDIGSWARFKAEFFFSGSRGPRMDAMWERGTDHSILLSTRQQNIAWSPCGGYVNFRINTAITAFKALERNGDPSIEIDTAVVQDPLVLPAFKYFIVAEQC